MAPRLRSSHQPYSYKDEEAPASSYSEMSESKSRKVRNASSFSVSQAFVLAAASASLATVLTAVGAAYMFTHRSVVYSRTMRSTIHQSLDAPFPHLTPNAGLLSFWGGQTQGHVQTTDAVAFPTKEDAENSSLFGNRIIKQTFLPQYDANEEAQMDGQPKVVWLMSFPNSGTSFTLHLTRESSNTTTATNYAWEGDIKDQPSVPAVTTSENGPFLELIPDRHTNIPEYILTKTHCGGFCTDCEPLRYIMDSRSFQVSCQSGRRARMTEAGLKLEPVVYNASLVRKSVHVIRHPLDNAVARFHLTFKQHSRKNDKEWMDKHPYGKEGFSRWCQEQNRHYDLSQFVDKRLADALVGVPCYPEMFRYIQWHNLAFTVGRNMGLETLVIHYSDYRDDLQNTITRLLTFLELPRSDGVYEFSTGKEYHDYYTEEQRAAVGRLVKEMATAETWYYLKDYDFS